MENQYSQQTNQNSDQQGNFNQQNDPYAGSYVNNVYGSSYNYGGSGSYQEPEKAPNIFQQFVIAFIPPQYSRLTKVKTGSMIGFVTLLALVATIISFVSFAISFAAVDSGEFMDSIPDFKIADGRLYMDGEYMYDEGGMFVFVTDEVSGYSYDTVTSIADEGYRTVILIGRDRISVLQNGEYQQGDFSNLDSDIEISKEWISNTLMPVVMVFCVVGYIFFFVGRILWYFLCAAIYLLAAMIIAAVMKKQLSAGALYRVAVYSKVLMFVVMTLLDLFPVVSNYVPFILRIAINIGFMAFAIIKLPDKR